MNSNSLLVLIKNPILGHAKTRIARTCGDLEALDIYEQLLTITRNTCAQSEFSISIYYSNFIDTADAWHFGVDKHLQLQAPDLGDRMAAAIKSELLHHDRVAIIGADCPTLTLQHLNVAFDALKNYDSVIGPSVDGGFYLLGLSEFDESLFHGIEWSTANVCKDLMSNLKAANRDYILLEELTDIDEYEDWLAFKEG